MSPPVGLQHRSAAAPADRPSVDRGVVVDEQYVLLGLVCPRELDRLAVNECLCQLGQIYNVHAQYKVCISSTMRIQASVQGIVHNCIGRTRLLQLCDVALLAQHLAVCHGHLVPHAKGRWHRVAPPVDVATPEAMHGAYAVHMTMHMCISCACASHVHAMAQQLRSSPSPPSQSRCRRAARPYAGTEVRHARRN